MPLSPAHNEDIGEEAQNESTSEEDYTPVTLTENILKMHDKIQEQVYLEELIKEKSGYLMSMQSLCKRRAVLATRTLQKRHAEQVEEAIAPKMLITDDRKSLPQMIQSNRNQQILLPPFPITNIETRRTNTSPTASFQRSGRDNSPAFSKAAPPMATGLPQIALDSEGKYVTISAGALDSAGHGCHLQTTSSVSSARPVCSSFHAPIAPPMDNDQTVGGFQWSSCPQSGMPMLQPFMYCLPVTPFYSPFGGPPTMASPGHQGSKSSSSSRHIPDSRSNTSARNLTVCYLLSPAIFIWLTFFMVYQVVKKLGTGLLQLLIHFVSIPNAAHNTRH